MGCCSPQGGVGVPFMKANIRLMQTSCQGPDGHRAAAAAAGPTTQNIHEEQQLRTSWAFIMAAFHNGS